MQNMAATLFFVSHEKRIFMLANSSLQSRISLGKKKKGKRAPAMVVGGGEGAPCVQRKKPRPAGTLAGGRKKNPG